MFIFIIILFTTGFIIEITEIVVDENIAIPAYVRFIMSFLTAMHVISGIFFVLLAAFHIAKNRGTLRNHLKFKNSKIGKESALTIALVLTAVILACITVYIREL
jgi:hypothetical protein